MFNTTINNPHTLQVRIDERRAPTDDSIRLYGEYRDKAIESILGVGKETMSIDQIQWTLVKMPEIRGIRLYLNFFIDGTSCEEEITMHQYDFLGSVQDKCRAIQDRIHERVIAAISREVEKRLFKSMAGDIAVAIVETRG